MRLNRETLRATSVRFSLFTGFWFGRGVYWAVCYRGYIIMGGMFRLNRDWGRWDWGVFCLNRETLRATSLHFSFLIGFWFLMGEMLR